MSELARETLFFVSTLKVPTSIKYFYIFLFDSSFSSKSFSSLICIVLCDSGVSESNGNMAKLCKYYKTNDYMTTNSPTHSSFLKKKTRASIKHISHHPSGFFSAKREIDLTWPSRRLKIENKSCERIFFLLCSFHLGGLI